ncbi:SRPBCC domain-containing protein [uncultured Pigmentiphaga sp.]|uniref:CoxG family protein n=1 Tax=uncultured Pigmentiphaga sp. TaxID=340361 RepID=UPI00263398E5|nr:SRPBCC domain-containing protein [uncultured Pigmentiphaga sp.]
MDFKIDAVLPGSAAQLWTIFFDVKRIASLIPGCEQVVEEEPLKAFSAVMKQKIGPFRLEVPTRISVESYEPERHIRLHATGTDKVTGTSMDVRLNVVLEEQDKSVTPTCRLAVDADMQIAGRLASLGYPIVRKRSEELFAEFERRLRARLSGRETDVPLVSPTQPSPSAPSPAIPADNAPPAAQPAPVAVPREIPAQPSLARQPKGTGNIELVFQWPRLGINLAVAMAVAHGAVAFGQSPWWWLVAPLLGAAASLGKRGD